MQVALDGDRVLMRDSKDPAGPILAFGLARKSRAVVRRNSLNSRVISWRSARWRRPSDAGTV